MSDTQFKVGPQRTDPYRNFKFLIRRENRIAAGVSRVSGLTPATGTVTPREDNASTAPLPSEQKEHRSIILERGVPHDAEFEQWANKVWNRTDAVGNKLSLSDFCKDIRIEVIDKAGQKVLAYKVYRCWVSEFTALPDLDASGNTIAIESMNLENEGWDLDTTTAEPEVRLA